MFTVLQIALIALIGQSAPVQVRIELAANGEEISGGQVSGTIPGSLEIKKSDGTVQTLSDASDIDVIRFANRERAPAGAWIVSLLDGSQLRGQIVGGDSEKLVLRNALVGDVSFGLDLVATVTRADQPDRAPAADSARPVEDLIAMLSGDTVSRSVAEITEQGVKVGSEKQEKLVAWDKIRSLRMANDPPNARPLVRLRLADGGILSGTRVVWNEDKITLATGDGQKLKLDGETVCEIEPLGGSREWLSELPVQKSLDIPYFDKTWPMRMNTNTVGGPLMMEGKVYSRGLGLHSAGRQTWQLGGQYERLRARVGIDDSAGPLADADFSVSLDGKQLFEWKGMKHKAPVRKIDLDVTGGRELTIEVGFGKNGMVQDRVDLVDAVLIKTARVSSSNPQN